MVEKISRSEQKRLFRQVEDVAAELAELTDNDLRRFPGGDELKAEIVMCRGLKGGARKRQIKYLAKVLRQQPLDEVYLFLEQRKGSELKEQQLLHRAERWRDIIVNEAMEIQEAGRKTQSRFEPDFSSRFIAEALEELPALDENDVRRCVYQYIRRRDRTYYRELYRMLKAALEAEERVLRSRPD